MNRAIVRAHGTVSVARLPIAAPGRGELSVATEYAGLCGTDIQMLRGLRDDPARVIGHEGVARVVAAGAGVPARLAPGTLVAINPTHPTDPDFLLGHNVDGLLQERTLVPATAVSCGLVLPLPETTDAAVAGPLLEPLAVVRYALAELGAFAPATLLVIGDGIVGHLAVRAAGRWLGPGMRVALAHHTGPGLAFSASRPYRADLLLDTVFEVKLDGPVAALIATPRDATVAALESALGVGAEVVDIVGGLPPGATTPLLPGVDLTAVRAANRGGLPDPVRVTTARLGTGRPVRLFGHRGVGNRHLLDAAAELARDPGRYRDLITHETDLDGAARVMRALARSRERTIDGRRLIKLSVRTAEDTR
ncbi:alcohol dehydrogenase catalytic domain-containing protein [Actinokineospora fastidiosa]|uniref:Zn-dependent alcohol dehydrogenase n=1 Tax=Actinokineospora fastidiosa TaxID=1816 RepID=A0A918LGA2_9PSEU|nr:alcohol dehydrogenase catalytic domain-containing protein [Actinokineospora fastidiosa]GGS44946.1 Zn-dependent alcohol dehydrogenase [Actinokineospora fastidiosa]